MQFLYVMFVVLLLCLLNPATCAKKTNKRNGKRGKEAKPGVASSKTNEDGVADMGIGTVEKIDQIADFTNGSNAGIENASAREKEALTLAVDGTTDNNNSTPAVEVDHETFVELADNSTALPNDEAMEYPVSDEKNDNDSSVGASNAKHKIRAIFSMLNNPKLASLQSQLELLVDKVETLSFSSLVCEALCRQDTWVLLCPFLLLILSRAF